MEKKTAKSNAAETAKGPGPGVQQPVFYRNLEALTAERHGSLLLKPDLDFRFAKNTNAVPITDVEFAAASRFYPIVFTSEPVAPIVVLGLQNENLFVEDNGHWAGPDHYIPAYVRRYPFIFIEHPGGFTLGLDRACERIVEADAADRTGEPFFVDGQPSAFTKDALNFSAQLQNQHRVSREFGAALAEQNLLVDREANAVLKDGQRFNIQGFKVVDAEKFKSLPGAVILDWHRKGWLGLVHFHLASLDRFRDLMLRMPKAAA